MNQLLLKLNHFVKSRFFPDSPDSFLFELTEAVEKEDFAGVVRLFNEMRQKKIDTRLLTTTATYSPTSGTKTTILYHAPSASMLEFLIKQGVEIKEERSETQTKGGFFWHFRDKPGALAYLISIEAYKKIDGPSATPSSLLEAMIDYRGKKIPPEHLQNIAVLLDKEPNLVNAKFVDDTLPLFKLAFWGQTEAGKILLSRGAHKHVGLYTNTEIENSFNETALTIAADKGHEEFVDMLLASSQDLSDLESFEEQVSASSGNIDNKYYQKIQDAKETFIMKDMLEENVPALPIDK